MDEKRVALKDNPKVVGIVMVEADNNMILIHWGVQDKQSFDTWHSPDELIEVENVSLG